MSEKTFNKEEMKTALMLVFRHINLPFEDKMKIIDDVKSDIFGHRNAMHFDDARSEESKVFLECLEMIKSEN